ncbi:hypothetical protein GCM10007103_01720 [Salinimicrobium marinum]|uniref:DUF748 domain-containing protein n=1 Tax=Salinimicrobium marinum TaxID=680283 RepID=A0A918S7B0_9FLAO|nr:hypothetical protein GCM10007103_01720 [Salinimicrobium marinum]
MLGFYAEQQIKKSFDEDLSGILTYEELDVSVVNRRITLTRPEINYAENNMEASEISVDGINYYQYLVNKKIRIGIIEITDPEIILRDKEEDSATGDSESEFEEDIVVNSVEIKNGTLLKTENDTATTDMFLSLRNFRITDVSVNAEAMKKKIPFGYDTYNFEVDSLRMELNDQHNFSTGAFSGDNGNFSIDDLRIIPKYDKVEFQRHIPYEKDRFELLIKNVSLKDLSWIFENDSLRLESSLLIVNRGDLEVYRNKLIRDDPRIKTLYSEKLRNMPVKVDINEIQVKNTKIVYQEKINEDRPPGEVEFYEVDAEIQDLTNIGMGQEDFPKTKITANALFHNETPLQINWEFDISSKTDAFTISGNLEKVSEGAINSFLRPAMNVEARGGIESLYFTYSGNDDAAQGDVRIVYTDFKVNVLKDDGTEKSSFWSAVANLFISNDAVNDDVENNDLEVTRDKNKSFWNYLWLMVREGALASFI